MGMQISGLGFTFTAKHNKRRNNRKENCMRRVGIGAENKAAREESLLRGIQQLEAENAGLAAGIDMLQEENRQLKEEISLLQEENRQLKDKTAPAQQGRKADKAKE